MRIRTIKPEFFMHDGLHDLEKESALPVRIAFVGLWCAADREGRFRWEPRRLKAQILPYDECDFSRVLDALTTRGFLVKYRVRDAWFGAIPTWKKHQIINNKERSSELPQMPPAEDLDALTTRDDRVHHACLKEGKGREGEGNTIAPADAVAAERPKDLVFEALCSATGTDARSLTKSGRGALNAALRDIRAASPGVTPEEITRRANRYSRKFPSAALTAPALAKHWAACVAPPADDWTRQQIKNATKAEPLQPADILADLPDVKRQFGIA